jgi:hypothetical protein
MVEWPRGEARDCKSLYTGSNPVSTSIFDFETKTYLVLLKLGKTFGLAIM